MEKIEAIETVENIEDISVSDIKFSEEPETAAEDVVVPDEDNNGDGGTTDTETQPVQVEESANAEEVVDDSYQFSDLAEETGFEIGSKEDVVNLLKEYAELKDKDPLSTLSPVIQEAIKAERAGMDLNHFFSVRNMDFDKMDNKEVLRQKFLKDNASLAKDNPDFANRRFEREYNAKYGNLNKEFEDEFEKEEFLKNNKDDLDFARMELDHEVKSAREELKKWQDDSTKIPEAQTDPEVNNAELIEQHMKQVDEYFEGFNGIEIPLDGDKMFKVGLDDKDVQNLKEVLKNPSSFLERIGFTQEGINIETLAPIVTLLEKSNSIGKLISDYSLEMRNKELVTSDLENPREIGAVNSSTPGVKSLEEQIADEFDRFD